MNALDIVILLLFIHIVSPRKKHIPEWCLIVVNTVLYTASIFRRICFWISENNDFTGGIGLLTYTCAIISGILLMILLWESIREFHPSRGNENLIPVMATQVIALPYLMDANAGVILQPVSFLTIAVVVCCSMYYSSMHLHFVREHEDEMKKGQRMQIMISQIQPRFLYNTLSTIQAMCSATRKYKPSHLNCIVCP